VIATNNKRTPNNAVSAGEPSRACSRAPARPPAALATPKVHRTRRSTWPRSIQNRSAVPMKCGTETMATATFRVVRSAITGVKRLPMPKPVTDAMAAPSAATTARSASRIRHQLVTRI
jgi:hypothetical protein